MKIILSATLILLSFAVSSQSWCDDGANWKYSFFSASYATGYTEISYVGDTTISGQSAKILNKQHNVYSFPSSQYESNTIGEEYTYEDNGVVYLWYENDWDTLYNFNASIGESWRMAKQPLVAMCDSNSVLTATDTGTMIVNAIPLKYLVVDFSHSSALSDTIVEKIGFINNYMFPYDNCNGQLDVNEGGVFRCYKDDNFTTYKPNYSGDCEFIVGLNEFDSALKFQITPNPASTQIELTGVSDQDLIMIYDLQGKVWPINRAGNIIEIDKLPDGVYMLSVRNDKSVSHKRFVKQ
jgi:hypothetical protein